MIWKLAEMLGEPSNTVFEELAEWNRQIKSLGGLPDELKGVVSKSGNPPCPSP